jgi:hypothetical protein
MLLGLLLFLGGDEIKERDFAIGKKVDKEEFVNGWDEDISFNL